jgi:hypothetical protein
MVVDEFYNLKYVTFRPGLVAHTVILATQEAEMGRIAVPGQPRQKVLKTSSQRISGAWRCLPVIPGRQEAEMGGSRYRHKNETLIEK